VTTIQQAAVADLSPKAWARPFPSQRWLVIALVLLGIGVLGIVAYAAWQIERTEVSAGPFAALPGQSSPSSSPVMRTEIGRHGTIVEELTFHNEGPLEARIERIDQLDARGSTVGTTPANRLHAVPYSADKGNRVARWAHTPRLQGLQPGQTLLVRVDTKLKCPSTATEKVRIDAVKVHYSVWHVPRTSVVKLPATVEVAIASRRC
jgi:hypothetical protein